MRTALYCATLDPMHAEFAGFDEWLGALPHRYKIVTAGNHDWCLERTENRRLITRGTLLLDESIEVEGIKVHMSPSARRFSNRRAFTLESAAQAREVWGKIPGDVDILVTHGPPQGILDIDQYVTGDHPQGCPVLRDVVESIRPPIHVFGHIHRSAGVFRGEHTIFVNCSIASSSEHEEMGNGPRVFEIG